MRAGWLTAHRPRSAPRWLSALRATARCASLTGGFAPSPPSASTSTSAPATIADGTDDGRCVVAEDEACDVAVVEVGLGERVLDAEQQVIVPPSAAQREAQLRVANAASLTGELEQLGACCVEPIERSQRSGLVLDQRGNFVELAQRTHGHACDAQLVLVWKLKRVATGQPMGEQQRAERAIGLRSSELGAVRFGDVDPQRVSERIFWKARLSSREPAVCKSACEGILVVTAVYIAAHGVQPRLEPSRHGGRVEAGQLGFGCHGVPCSTGKDACSMGCHGKRERMDLG